MQKSLFQLLNDLSIFEVKGKKDIIVSGLTNDSRQVRPGDLFFAIDGNNQDGHLFIEDAISKGACALVVEKEVPSVPVTTVYVPDTRQAQALIANYFYNYPSNRLNTIGITGTNGKTTTTFMIDYLLNKAGYQTGLMSTLYNKVKLCRYSTHNTTSDVITNHQLLYKMVEEDVSHAILEVSSHGLLMERVTGIAFDVGIITNISQEHFEIHSSFMDYVNTKKRLFSMIDKKGYGIFNGDDPVIKTFLPDMHMRTITFGIENSLVNVSAQNIRTQNGKILFDSCINVPFNNVKGKIVKPCIFPITLQILGNHNVANALIAITLGLIYDIPVSIIRASMFTYPGIFRRMETVYQGAFRVIDDATHNPHNLNAVLKTISQEDYAGLLILYAIRGNRGIKINQDIARMLVRWVNLLQPKKLLITRCDDVATLQDKVQEDEERIFWEELKNLKGKYEYIHTLSGSIKYILEVVEKDDLVLLSGAHPMDHAAEMMEGMMEEPFRKLPRPLFV